ncbi:MAG: 4-hydroxy-3-methylbut-2-enyl diphosphate reductase [Fusobacteriia bacterium 4572_132]|nr:MAG: 4-hydroxy-3-methylbut-2-enyl diphosphate reductase [Fusobacteriia bacterium 4572_132]
MKNNKIEIVRAKKMGFCFGVKEALKLTEEIIKKEVNKRIFMLGMLVHNKEVINELKEKNVEVLEEMELENINENDVVIIRAHGVEKKIYERLEKKKVKIYDAACVFVKKSRNMLQKYEGAGYKIIFIGDKNHPEVKGIVSYGVKVIVISNKNNLMKFVENDKDKKYFILAQTTLNKNYYNEIQEYVKKNMKNSIVGDTICGATYERQIAVEDLAKNVEMMLIVGGYNSSNTKKLYNISKKINDKSYHIETEKDLELEWLKDIKKIGITAGASTPAKSIKGIEQKIKEATMSETMDFEKMLENYLPDNIEKGEVKKGIILRKDREYGYLDLGTKGEGKVDAREIEDNEVGDEIEVLIITTADESEDFMKVSRRAVELKLNWEKLQELKESDEKINGKIVRKVKGGYIVDILKYNSFMPGSLSGFGKEEEPLGKEITVKIKDIQDGKRKKIVVSRKAVEMQNVEEELNKINEDDVVEGIVNDVLAFGVSLKVGSISGFVHISEIAWKRVDNLEEKYNVGDTVSAKVISINKAKKSLKLSIKQLKEDPWTNLEEKYPLESEVVGKVVRIEKYGAFIELEEGIEGLLHISDFSWSQKMKSVKNYVKLNDEIKVKIIELDEKSKKMKLSLKALAENPWETVETKYAIGTEHEGTIVEIKDFGIFVELEKDMDAFVHISDLEWNNPSIENFKKEEKVKVKIIEINKEERKIKAGIKQLTKSPLEEVFEKYSEGDIIKRKIISIANFGIFVELEKGIDGMIHISEASKEFVKNLEEKYKVGDEVEAKIIMMDEESKKIKLSIKEIEMQEEKKEEEELLEKYSNNEK